MPKLYIKPLSVNKSYRWKKTKTYDLIEYHKEIKWYIDYITSNNYFDYINFNEKWLKLKVDIVFWYSSKWSDIDNWLKPFLDWLFSALWVNDNLIYELNVKKDITKKDEEYIYFNISKL